MVELKNIEVRGAREHNLKNIDVDIPRDQLVVITGLSGSGKSSLAFDTIYAEGQRRYVESLSAYARQFLDMMEKPDVDHISGLSPAISIEQKTTSKNPRSTVGTVTEIYDYMRLLFARVGTPFSPETGLPIEAQQVQDMVDRVMAMEEGTRGYLLAPIVRDRKGEYRKEFAELRKQGFQRIKVDGAFYDLDEPPTLDKKFRHDIDVVVDRIVVREGVETRLADSFRTALDLADGITILETAPSDGDPERHTFSEKFACPVSGFTIPEIEPRLFSFNAPFGACPQCDGLGVELFFDERLVVPDQTLKISDGALAPWRKGKSPYFLQTIESIAKHYAFKPSAKWKDLPEKVQKVFLYGSGKEEILFRYDEAGRVYQVTRSFEGVIPNMERRYRETDSNWIREEFERYQNNRSCGTCGGYRLRAEALAVKIAGLHAGQVVQMSIKEAFEWCKSVPDQLSKQKLAIAGPILKEIRERLGFLNNVGLEYLTLARNSGTLSGGESQRIQLATSLGSSLVGSLYILDEPSIGLHPKDAQQLITVIQALRDNGNTVVVVEHEEAFMRAADFLIDIGPAAGNLGGEIIAAGLPQDVLSHPTSLTAAYLNGTQQIPIPQALRKATGEIILEGVRQHNLKGFDISFPLGVFSVVAGVSGSGKSTLIKQILYPALKKHLEMVGERPGIHKALKGDLDAIQHVEMVDQNPIGKSSRSNPVTYLKAYDDIRNLFASEELARIRGYKAKHFSFNTDGGRCDACKGEGEVTIEMQFMADVHLPCETCNGKRFKAEILEIKFHGKTISDILDCTIDEAIGFFAAHNERKISNKLQPLQDVGLGYAHVGQSSSTLSGGEAQRVKLAFFLSKGIKNGKTLFLFDEPTTGLHFDDVKKLLRAFNELVDLGHTVIVIEHDLDVIQRCDHVIEIGPEGGELGGQLLYSGPPDQLIKVSESPTAEALETHLKQQSQSRHF